MNLYLLKVVQRIKYLFEQEQSHCLLLVAHSGSQMNQQQTISISATTAGQDVCAFVKLFIFITNYLNF